MKYKLFLSDIDDTLTTMHNEFLPEYTLAALKRFENQGIRFIPCTGRPLAMMPKNCDKLNLHYAVIANGGGIYSYDEERYIFDTFIESEVLERFAKNFEKLEGFIFYFVNEAIWCDTRYRQKKEGTGLPIDQTGTVYVDGLNDRFVKEGIIAKKMVVMTSEENRPIYMDAFKRDFPELNITSFSSTSIEVTLKGADKGHALRFLSDHLNIALEEMIYAGDNDNDIPALTIAGLSIAPANATKAARDAAMITALPVNEDGVVKAIEKELSKH